MWNICCHNIKYSCLYGDEKMFYFKCKKIYILINNFNISSVNQRVLIRFPHNFCSPHHFFLTPPTFPLSFAPPPILPFTFLLPPPQPLFQNWFIPHHLPNQGTQNSLYPHFLIILPFINGKFLIALVYNHIRSYLCSIRVFFLFA